MIWSRFRKRRTACSFGTAGKAPPDLGRGSRDGALLDLGDATLDQSAQQSLPWHFDHPVKPGRQRKRDGEINRENPAELGKSGEREHLPAGMIEEIGGEGMKQIQRVG